MFGLIQRSRDWPVQPAIAQKFRRHPDNFGKKTYRPTGLLIIISASRDPPQRLPGT